jgi:hypothetical protein
LILTRSSLYDRKLAGRDFLSRQSMLMKKIAGYDGVSQCPPDPRPKLSTEERRLVSWWIGTGMTETGKDAAGNLMTRKTRRGAFADTLPPALVVLPAARPTEPVTQIIVGATDPDSGLAAKSLSVKASWPVEGRAANTELADLFKRQGDRWLLKLSKPVSSGELTVSVHDQAGVSSTGQRIGSEPGNRAIVVRTFSVVSPPPKNAVAMPRR